MKERCGCCPRISLWDAGGGSHCLWCIAHLDQQTCQSPLAGGDICAPRQLISPTAAPLERCWLCWALRDAGSHPVSYSVSRILSCCSIKTLLIS